MVVIEAESLVKKFGTYTALREMSFRVEGDVVAVLGPNGSGKTTLLSIMAGLRRPTRGSLRVNGVEPYRDRRWAFTAVSFMFERPRLPLSVRVRDVVEVVGDCEYADFFHERMGLRGILGRRLHALSMGEAQLVGLYASICKGSDVIILDEPFAHLDARRAAALYDLLWSLRGRRSIVFSTHSPEEAESLADSVVILDGGSLVWSGRLEELARRGVYEVLVSPAGRRRLERELVRAGATVVTCLGGHCLVSGADPQLLARLVGDGVILGFKVAGVRGYYAGLGPRPGEGG